MDILRFINSRDIQKYLGDIHYAFSSLEAAWLVWQCRDASIAEKHQAWREIIETMPDCTMEARHNTLPRDSLHDFLRQLIEAENRRLARFYENNGHAVYMFCYRYPDTYGWHEECKMIYTTFEDCLQAVRVQREFDPCKYLIRKRSFDSEQDALEVTLSEANQVMAIRGLYATDCSEADYDLLFRGLGGLCFRFPTPFQTGDVVCDSCETDGQTPFVLTDIFTPDGSEEAESWAGDHTDMTGWGYFQNPDLGSIYHDCMHGYMDLEYYRSELDGKHRVLKALSNFLKGEIDIGLYSQAYHTILQEEYIKKMWPTGYGAEGLALAGLHQEDSL